MSTTVQNRKTPPVLFATAGNGLRLPVIDVTHPAFALADDAEAVAAIREAFVAEVRQRRPSRLPRFLQKPLMALALSRSPLTRSMTQPSGTDFFGGLSTYATKLGPDNLVSPFKGRYDRQLAASPFARSLRVRLSQLARLSAEALVPVLKQKPGLALHFINIAGGPASDSLNTLIVLAGTDPDLLARPVVIHVLDGDGNGPEFGKNALAALSAANGPLEGFDIAFDFQIHDWHDTAPLAALVDTLAKSDAIIVGASEGGLFEYGSDEAIVGNLRALNPDEGGAAFVFGSVTRNDQISKGIASRSAFSILPRGLDAFADLAKKAGYAIAKSEASLMSDQVVMRPL